MRSKNKSSHFRPLRTAGFTLIEIMISITIGSIIIAGLGALFIDISKIQSQASTQTAMAQVSAKLKSAIADQSSWQNIVNVSKGGSSNAIFLCAALPTPNCTPSPVQTDFKLYPAFDTIRDGASSPLYGNVIYQDNNSNGYTYQGTPCTGFNSPPNDNCPFSYRLRVQYSCPSSTSCLVPQVTVYGILEYKPDPSTASYRNLSLDKFSFRVVKGVNTPLNDVIQVSETTNAGASSPAGPSCPVTGIARVFNTKDFDSACTSAVTNCNVISLNPLVLKAGTYVCYASAQGFGVDAFSLSVNVASAPTAPPIISPVVVAASAPVAVLDTANLSNFTVSRSTNFQLDIIQSCQSTGVAPWSLGLPIQFGASYGTSIYATISCTRIL